MQGSNPVTSLDAHADADADADADTKRIFVGGRDAMTWRGMKCTVLYANERM